MTEEIYGIEVDCNVDLDVTLKTPTEDDEEISWEFIVHANSEVLLRLVYCVLSVGIGSSYSSRILPFKLRIF